MSEKTAVIYARVSDKKQVENDISIPGQIERGHEKALSLKSSVLQVFTDEGISGRSDNRPSFEAAIDFCEIYKVDYFICWSSSRFARNRFNAAIYKRRLDNCGTKLEYLTFSVDRDTDSGRLLDGFLEIMDEHKSVQTSKDTIRSLIRNAQLGYWNGGRPAFGFKVVPAEDNPKKKRLAVNNEESYVVKKIFELRCEGYGIRTIAQWLNENNHFNRSNTWKKNTIANLLNNMAVLGKTAFGKTSKTTGKKQPRENWIIADSHEAIITQELWDKAHSEMDNDNLNTRTSSSKSMYKFTGLLKCGECGAAMHTESAKGRTRRYWYYNCSASKLKKSHPPRRLPAVEIDDFLVECIVTNIFTRETLTGILTDLYDVSNRWLHDHSERRLSVLNSIKGIQKKLDNLYSTLELFGKDAPNLGDLTKRLRQHNTQIKVFEGKLNIIDKEEPPKVDVTDEDVTQLLEFLIKTIRESDDPKKVRMFFKTFIQNVVVESKSLKITYDPQRLVNRPEWTVPSTRIWLPERDLLGTKVIKLDLPEKLQKKAA